MRTSKALLEARSALSKVTRERDILQAELQPLRAHVEQINGVVYVTQRHESLLKAIREYSVDLSVLRVKINNIQLAIDRQENRRNQRWHVRLSRQIRRFLS